MDSTFAAAPGLAGLRVLVAEDEPLIAMLIVDALEELECVALGAFATLPSAVAAAQESEFDVALIDFNLQGEKAFALTEALRERGLPFAIVSGAPSEVEGNGEFAVVAKPFKTEDIGTTLRAMAQHAGGSR